MINQYSILFHVTNTIVYEKYLISDLTKFIISIDEGILIAFVCWIRM